MSTKEAGSTDQSRQDSSSLDMEEVIKNIRTAYDYEKDNNEMFENYNGYIFDKSLTDDDVRNLEAEGKPTFNFPIIRSYLNNSLKNVRDSSPSVCIEALDGEEIETQKDPVSGQQMQFKHEDVADILTKKVQYIFERSKYKRQIHDVAKNAFVGGKGVFFVNTRYVNNYDFEQEMYFESVEDPTKVYYDPAAKMSTKSDGQYQYFRDEIPENAFIKIYGQDVYDKVKRKIADSPSGFLWIMEDIDTKKKVVRIVDYYYKVTNKKKLYSKENGEVVFSKKEAPKDAPFREVDENKVYMVRICAGIELTEPKELNFDRLPYVCTPGAIFLSNGKKSYVPYGKPAMDAQRTKNFMANFFLFEALNNRTSTDYIAVESISEKYLELMRQPGRKKLIPYKQYHKSDSGEMLQLNPPHTEPATPLPDQYMEMFSAMDESIEKILGSQFPSLDETNLSGKALYNLADFFSASNEELMHHLLESVTEIGEILLTGLPKVQGSSKVKFGEGEEEQTILYNYDFEPSRFHMIAKPGVNYKLQQQATVEHLIDLAQASPPFAQFLYTAGMNYLLDNIDLNNKDKLMSAYEAYMQQQQQMAQQQGNTPNPEVMNAQARMLMAQTKQQEAQLDSVKLGHEMLLDHQKVKAENFKTRVAQQQNVIDSHLVHKKNLVDGLTKANTIKSSNQQFLATHLNPNQVDSTGSSGSGV